jgi:hypothetical protein
MATAKEDFTAFIRMGKDGDPEPVEFAEGEEVSIVQEWEGALVLIKNEDGKLFNVKKTLIDL